MKPVLLVLWLATPNGPDFKEMKYFNDFRTCEQARKVLINNVKDMPGFINAFCLTTKKSKL